MGQTEGIFYDESRVYSFPALDLNGFAPNTLVTPTGNNVLPLQLSKEGDWAVYGLSAVKFAGPAGDLPSNTPVNLQIKDQDTSEDYFRQSQQQTDSGTPLDQVAGKCGFPALGSWPRLVGGGSRLYPQMQHFAAAAPTAASIFRVVAHCVLLRPGTKKAAANGLQSPMVPIGSKAHQMKRWGGFWTQYTGLLDFTTTPLSPQQTATIEVSIAGSKYFFVDSLWCRQSNTVAVPPNNAENCLIDETAITVSLKDTTSLSNWTAPNRVPLWSVFGSQAAFPYVPPTAFCVRPLGNISIELKNESAANLTDRFEFTFGGILVDLPDEVVARELTSLK